MSEPESSSRDAQAIWDYRLHEDSIFYERHNFFLVAESMLLVAYTTAITASQPSPTVAAIVTGLGGVLTVAW